MKSNLLIAFTVLLIVALAGYLLYTLFGDMFSSVGRAIASSINKNEIPITYYNIVAHNLNEKGEIIIHFVKDIEGIDCINNVYLNKKPVNYSYTYNGINIILILDKNLNQGDELKVEFCNNKYILNNLIVT